MPYEIRQEGDGYKVYKKGSDKSYSKKPISKRQAKKQAAALYANENKTLPPEEATIDVVDAGGKCYTESYNHWMALPQDDSRVNYDPVGMSGGQACANCQWFQPGSSSCYLVAGPIVATGLSDLWMEKIPYEPEPMKVQIVGDTAADDKSNTPNLVQRFLQQLGVSRKDTANIDDTVPGFKAFVHNERKVWAAWWTNNFEDRKKEIFPEHAIDAFVKRIDDGVIPKPQLWHRHLPVNSGQADWIGRIGHLVLAAGHFHDTEVGDKFYQYYSTGNKDWEVSHGFLFPKNLVQDNTYHAFNTYEISPLPAGEACNPLTTFSVKGIYEMAVKGLTPEKEAELRDILGPAWSEKYLDFGAKRSDELEKLGLNFKEFGGDPKLEGIQDAGARTGLQALAQAQKDIDDKVDAGLKGVSDKLDQLVTILQGFKQKIDEIETRSKGHDEFLQAQFGLAPRASRAQETLLNPQSEYIQFMKKQNESGGEGNSPTDGGTVFDEIFKFMKGASPVNSE